MGMIQQHLQDLIQKVRHLPTIIISKIIRCKDHIYTTLRLIIPQENRGPIAIKSYIFRTEQLVLILPMNHLSERIHRQFYEKLYNVKSGFLLKSSKTVESMTI
jgi:hypothetical protein